MGDSDVASQNLFVNKVVLDTDVFGVGMPYVIFC